LFDIIPVLRVQKTGQNFFIQKTVKLYLISASNIKNKIKFSRLVAGTKYGVFGVIGYISIEFILKYRENFTVQFGFDFD
jgi:hypothetical protein